VRGYTWQLLSVDWPLSPLSAASIWWEKLLYTSKTISKTGPNSYGCFHSKAHQEALMRLLFTIAVSASRRSSLILLVVELTKEPRGCNSSLSRNQVDAGKRALKDLMRGILNSKNQWLNSL